MRWEDILDQGHSLPRVSEVVIQAQGLFCGMARLGGGLKAVQGTRKPGHHQDVGLLFQMQWETVKGFEVEKSQG